ncbi:MAG: TspO/MBR family protein [bacterium]|nr:TspO/MBR family protein [bacterium]
MAINFAKLIFSIGICLGAGIVGSMFTASSISTWYITLNKPFFSTPNWVFAPVWTFLYILMGLSLYLVINDMRKVISKMKGKAVTIFAVQLILNVSWSIVFFGMRNPILAFVNIAALWLAIFLTLKSFGKINKLAGNLLIPYLLWVSFASILNFSVALLNL